MNKSANAIDGGTAARAGAPASGKAAVRRLERWCDRAWIKFGCAIAALMSVAILATWNVWDTELKVTAAIAVLLPLHVVEEWVFPGGFHYQYNTMYKSDRLDRFPMCRLSDMATNLLITFLYAALARASAATGTVSTGIVLGTFGFCIVEVIVHTMIGIKMYRKFKPAGKTTIYGPGSITAYFGFGVLGAILAWCMLDRVPVLMDWVVCLGILFYIGGFSILIVENALNKRCDEFVFPSAGYYERFLK